MRAPAAAMLNTLCSLGHRYLPSLTAGLIGVLILWLCLVRALRWRRYNAIYLKYGPKWNNGLGSITPQEAQEIMHVSGIYDMPWLVSLGSGLLVFLNTYGIVSTPFSDGSFETNHAPNKLLDCTFISLPCLSCSWQQRN